MYHRSGQLRSDAEEPNRPVELEPLERASGRVGDRDGIRDRFVERDTVGGREEGCEPYLHDHTDGQPAVASEIDRDFARDPGHLGADLGRIGEITLERMLLAEALARPALRVDSGRSLAARALALAPSPDDDAPVRRSARNRFTGIVTGIEISGLVAQVELQCGPNRVVSLMTAEAARDLALEIGSRATAIVKATTVIIETERN